MTFLKLTMLLGLAAIAIPILIHLLNRSKPRMMEWGAMQFLLASLAARRRRIMLEELILLCLRCLTVALVVLAMARPFLPSRSAVPWALVLPAVLIAAVCAGMAAQLWTNTLLRRRLLRAAVILAVAAAALAFLERQIQARHWLSSESGRDIVIVLDSSSSMTVSVDGQSNFNRAVAEAQALVKACRPGDAFSVLLAGPVPHPLIRRPTSDRREVRRALQSPECRPTGGSMSVLEALNAAAALLAEGPNPAKAVILFTDGQNAGWDTQADGRWGFVADRLKGKPNPARVIVRRLSLPKVFRNATVTDIAFSRRVIGTDRPVRIDVRVLNAGADPAEATAVELFVDGQRVERTPIVKDLLPQVTEVMHYEYMFETPGRHVVRAQVVADDDLMLDNTLDTVVTVLDRMPVLIVDGSSAVPFFHKAAGFIRVALTPRSDEQGQKKAPEKDDTLRFLIEPKVASPSELVGIPDLEPYRAVILVNVPRLPSTTADRIAAYVRKGGGLLIVPGPRSEPDFYNHWQTPAGQPFAPAVIKERRAGGEPAHFELKSFSHPTLRLAAEPQHSDAESALVTAYNQMVVDGQDTDVRVGGLLDTGDPMLVERQVGKGYVLMTAMSLDRHDGNLPSLKCFVPLVHEIVYYLAAPMMMNDNVKPGTEFALEGVCRGAVPAASATASNAPVTVRMPAGDERPGALTVTGNRFLARFTETRAPGLYVMRLPAALAPAGGAVTNGLAEVPFTVTAQPEEGTITQLSDNDLAAVGHHLDLFLPAKLEEMLAAFAGEVPGQELWKFLALCALLTILAEVVLARWIAIHRRFHDTEPVALRSPVQSVQALKDRLQDLLRRSGTAGSKA